MDWQRIKLKGVAPGATMSAVEFVFLYIGDGCPGDVERTVRFGECVATLLRCDTVYVKPGDDRSVELMSAEEPNDDGVVNLRALARVHGWDVELERDTHAYRIALVNRRGRVVVSGR